MDILLAVVLPPIPIPIMILILIVVHLIQVLAVPEYRALLKEELRRIKTLINNTLI